MSKDQIAAINATPEQISMVTSIINDPLETSITLNTRAFYQAKRGLLGFVPFDQYLRAFIDKKTGVATFQLVVELRYGGTGWLFLDRLNYETPKGPEAATVHILARDVGSCSGYGGCDHTEIIAADIPESVLREVAAGASPGNDVQWSWRVFGQRGLAQTTGMLKTEVAGMLLAVDRESAHIKM